MDRTDRAVDRRRGAGGGGDRGVQRGHRAPVRAVRLRDVPGARTLEEFALEAARPARPRVPDVTWAELVEIVRRVLDGDPETGYYLLVLDANVARRDAADLIFHPPPGLEGASAGEIVDAILAYRPFSL